MSSGPVIDCPCGQTVEFDSTAVFKRKLRCPRCGQSLAGRLPVEVARAAPMKAPAPPPVSAPSRNVPVVVRPITTPTAPPPRPSMPSPAAAKSASVEGATTKKRIPSKFWRREEEGAGPAIWFGLFGGLAILGGIAAWLLIPVPLEKVASAERPPTPAPVAAEAPEDTLEPGAEPKRPPPAKIPAPPTIPPLDLSPAPPPPTDKSKPKRRTLDNVLEDLRSSDPQRGVKAMADLDLYFAGNRRIEVAKAIFPWLKNTDESVRAEAVKILKKFITRDTSDGLIPLTSDENTFVRRQAITMLGDIRESNALPALVERLQEDNTETVEAIKKMGTASEPAVRQGMRHQNKVIRFECLKLLEFVGTRASLSMLRNLAQNDPSGDIRGDANRAVLAIERRLRGEK